jgi:hypothetical protein
MGAMTRKAWLELHPSTLLGDRQWIVWILADKGMRFTATVYGAWLGPDNVLAGEHKGRQWFPVDRKDLDGF